MAERPFTLIDDGRALELAAVVSEGAVRLSPAALEAALGWQVTPEGLCGHGMCLPLPEDPAPGGIDLAALADLLDRPLALDAAEGVACLGAPAGERAARLAALEAPDFALPDLEGRTHSLSEQRGRKVLVVAWGSW